MKLKSYMFVTQCLICNITISSGHPKCHPPMDIQSVILQWTSKVSSSNGHPKCHPPNGHPKCHPPNGRPKCHPPMDIQSVTPNELSQHKYMRHPLHHNITNMVISFFVILYSIYPINHTYRNKMISLLLAISRRGVTELCHLRKNDLICLSLYVKMT